MDWGGFAEGAYSLHSFLAARSDTGFPFYQECLFLP